MGKNKESDQENDGNKKGLQLDPGFISFDAEDDLDYSRVRQDKNLELWLLQIPVDFPLDENVVWRATEPGSARVSAITEIEESGYRLVEEQETGQAPVYAIGGDIDNNPQPAKVTRRVNIVKRTDAQKVCFGIEDADVLENVDAGVAAATPAAETPRKDKAAKKEKKEKKKKKREEVSAEPDTEQKKKKSKKK